MKVLKFIWVVMILCITKPAFTQTITIAVEATFPKDQAEFVYEPLRNWLTKKTGMNIEIQSADNYYFYWRAAKNDEPDFALDASHIAAYRMEEKKYIPLARVQEDISYFLIANTAPQAGQSIGEFLVGNKVVTLPTPNLGSILFDQWFTDLFLQPQKVVTALSWEDAIEQVFAQTADAAIIPSSLFELYPNFATLKESRKFPGLTFTASPNVSKAVQESFKKAIMGIGKDEESFNILAELNSNGFIEVDPTAYKGLSEILTQLVY